MRLKPSAERKALAEDATTVRVLKPGVIADLAVFIGRFQPFHDGHLHVVMTALRHARYVLIVTGSAQMAPRPDVNPWTEVERAVMIKMAIPAEYHDRIVIRHSVDFGNMDLWTANITRLATEVRGELKLGADVTLIGHSKDKSSFYLKAFPKWDSIEVPQHKEWSATPMREKYFHANDNIVNDFIYDEATQCLPTGTIEFLINYRKTEAYREQVAEWQFMKEYLAPYTATVPVFVEGKQIFNKDGSPKMVKLFPPKFVTVDNVVIQAGRVLLIQRKSYPGKNLWALPGGHLDDGETLQQASLRELREETRIRVPESVLIGSIVGDQPIVKDDPNRSMRKRTITHATVYHLRPVAPERKPGEDAAAYAMRLRAALDFPKIKAADDAKRAIWVPIEEIDRSKMMEDHYQIIMDALARIRSEDKLAA